MTRPASTSIEKLAEEYRALREGSGVVDLRDWTVLRLRGPDAQSFLQGVATQDLESVSTGSAVRALFLTEKGRSVAHAWVSIPDATSATILADAGARETLRPHLERFRIMEDVEFEGPDQAHRLLGVAGPARDARASSIAGQAQGATTLRAEPLSFILLDPASTPAASGLTTMVGPEAFEAWRLHVGLPLQGIDLDPDRIATELNLPEAISMTKGCYVGQEVVARTANRGKLRKQRFGFRFAWDGNPIPKGTELRSNDQNVGYVTSTTEEPGTKEGLGMGYIAPEALEQPADIHAVQGEKATHVSPHSWPL